MISSEKKVMITGFMLTVLALFPILWPAIQSISILLFVLLSIVFYWDSFLVRIKDKKAILFFIALTGYYLWFLISFFWSDNQMIVFKDVQSNLILLIFPLVFVFFHPVVDTKLRKRIQGVFIVAMLVYSYLWFQNYVTGVSYYQNLKLKTTVISESAFIEQLKFLFDKGYYWVSGSSIRGYRMAGEETKIFLHHSYISAYFLLAFLFCLDLIKSQKRLLFKLLILLPTAIFIVFILYLPSAVNKIAAVLCIFLFSFHFISKRLTSGILLAGIIALGILTIRHKDKLSNIKLFEKENLMSKEPAVFDFYRYHAYNCIFKEVQNIYLFGMGAGDIQPYLNSCLPDDEWPGLSETKMTFNTHSQFVNYFSAGGLIGLLLFILLWIRLFTRTVSQRHKMLLIILIIALFNTLFENFLSRIWGAFFFAFFTFVFMDIDSILVKTKQRLQDEREISR